MPQKPITNGVPDGWEVVETSPASNLPEGWEVVEASSEQPIAPKAETPSILSSDYWKGLAGNLLPSGGKFAADTVQGVYQLAKLGSRLGGAMNNPAEADKLGKDFINLVKNSPAIGKQILDAVGDRYGSRDAVLKTLYTDPVGVLADVASVAGTAATGGAGAEALAARLGIRGAETIGKVANVAGKIERIANPLTLPAMVVAKGAENAGALGNKVADLVIGTSVNPPMGVKSEFGGKKAVIAAIKKERLTNSDAAEQALRNVNTETDDVIAHAKAKGVQGPSKQILRDALEEVRPEAQRRVALGADRAAVDRLDKRINDINSDMAATQLDAALKDPNYHFDTATGQVSPSYDPNRIPLDDANKMKRSAQTLAFDAKAQSQSLEHLMNKKQAGALAKELEHLIPGNGHEGIAALNERSQRLQAVKAAMSAAEERGHGLTPYVTAGSVGAGLAGSLMFGNPIPALGGAITTLGTLALQNPRIGTKTGLFLSDAGNAVSKTGGAARFAPRLALGGRAANNVNEELLKALIARALEQEQPQ